MIEALLRIVILCGKQGLALRGHDQIDWQSQLVHFRAETDTILSTHLAKASKNAQYTSKTVQNELLSVVGNSIRNGSKFYSVIADEVTDAANCEELSLVFRCVFYEEIREVLLM